MKRIISLILSLMILMTVSFVPVMASGEEFNFSLLANGAPVETVGVGMEFDATLVIESNEGLSTFDIYSMQDYICFEPEYLEFVSASSRFSGINANVVKLMREYDRVYVSRNSYGDSKVTVDMPCTVVTVKFRAKKEGTTELTHDTMQLHKDGALHTVLGKDCIVHIVPTYNLTLNASGGNVVPGTVLVKEGDTVELKNYIPTRDGYKFEGWYSDSNTSNKVDSVVVNSATTVYAKWTLVPTSSPGGGGGGGGVSKYTVTFKNPDGSQLGKVTKEKGSTIALSAHTYTKDGYRFLGWYTDKELTVPAKDFNITSNTTLYAKWKEVVAGQVIGQYHPEILTTDHYAYIMGRDGGMICPEDNITRAEVATIFFRLLTEEVRIANITKLNIFDDVNSNDWHNTAVSTLAKLGIINGRSETAFEPDEFITRAEFATISARFSNAPYADKDMFTDVAGHWAEEYINKAAAYGWIVGDGGIFRPDDNITRAEVMTIVNRVLGRLPESEADLLPEMTKWKDNSDTSAWYYLAVQEATNSHDCIQKADGVHETWTKLNENPDWTQFE